MQTQPESEPPSDAVSSRAGGRPPEEGSSEDPERQARAILEESDERVRKGRSRPK
jgi:hypothetical protein